ncbi:MAG: beta-L-arabinofuranosidase domain-containing protein [Anaerolineales bacterium]
MTAPQAHLTPVPLDQVDLQGGFWAPRIEVNRRVTIPLEYQRCTETGRFEALKLQWKPGDPNPPHIFWDSDVAKWIEAAAYSLAKVPDPELEALVDDAVELLAAAQQPDGYLNSHFTVVEPQNRWTNLRDCHELYCAGHLIEAAVAYYRATGKDRFLQVMRRYADYIDTVFGPRPGQKRGYPGHEEIELALVKLYQVTGEPRYLALSKFFIDERGTQPHYFTQEALARGEDPIKDYHAGGYDYCQAHLPVREQKTAEGHAVRAMYLYSGMADVAREAGDLSLYEACQTLWRNVTERRMYVTGGIGSLAWGERFTVDYDLPNEVAYTETCAAIGLVFWAQRMLQLEPRGAYADVMERALYNGTISGVSLAGDRFFYSNPLEMDWEHQQYRPDLRYHTDLTPQRKEWYDCSCCPMNIARLIASLGQYVYATAPDAVYVHLYVQGKAHIAVGGHSVTLSQETAYPWKGDVSLVVDCDQPAEWTLALRWPGWCREMTITVNDRPIAPEPLCQDGYVLLKRTWQSGDRVRLSLAMPVERVRAHPLSRDTIGKVALQRGPVVYCFEQVDNGRALFDLSLPRDARLDLGWDADLAGGVVTITGEGLRASTAAWDDTLYSPDIDVAEPVRLVAVPYFAWANRTPGEMAVWIREHR